MDAEEYSLVVSNGLQKGEVLVMSVLLKTVITAVAKATILPRTTIILYIIKVTVHILKPRVHVEPVLNLIMKSGLDSVVRESLNGVNINFSVIISLNGVNINFSVINSFYGVN